MRLAALTSLIEHLGVRGPLAHEIAEYALGVFLSPEVFRKRLAEGLGVELEQVVVAGPHNGRLALVEMDAGRWIALHCEGGHLGRLMTLAGLRQSQAVEHPESYLSVITPSKQFLQRLTEPKIHLVALHRQEILPLPRFALGIAVLAGTLRQAYSGQVTLDDMQLERSLDDVVEYIKFRKPDIIGVSATFLQHQLLNDLLTRLQPGEGGGHRRSC